MHRLFIELALISPIMSQLLADSKLFHCVLLTFLKITGTSQNQNKNTDFEQCICEKIENLRMPVIAITILWRTTWSGHISQPVYKMSDACPVPGLLNCELVAVCQLAEQSSTSSPSEYEKTAQERISGLQVLNIVTIITNQSFICLLSLVAQPVDLFSRVA